MVDDCKKVCPSGQSATWWLCYHGGALACPAWFAAEVAAGERDVEGKLLFFGEYVDAVNVLASQAARSPAEPPAAGLFDGM